MGKQDRRGKAVGVARSLDGFVWRIPETAVPIDQSEFRPREGTHFFTVSDEFVLACSGLARC